jgi:hypothetical protein
LPACLHQLRCQLICQLTSLLLLLAQGKFRPNKLEVRPDEAATLEAEFAPLLSGHLKVRAVDWHTHLQEA